MLKPLVEVLSDPDSINRMLLSQLEQREQQAEQQKKTYTYAASYEDFIKLISTSTDVNFLTQLRHDSNERHTHTSIVLINWPIQMNHTESRDDHVNLTVLTASLFAAVRLPWEQTVSPQQYTRSKTWCCYVVSLVGGILAQFQFDAGLCTTFILETCFHTFFFFIGIR